jgi:hypothetical protein
MFCDDVLAEMSREPNNAQLSVATEAASKNVVYPLTLAQKFVLSPLTVETAEQLADPEKVEATRDYLFTPARDTWIEWREGSVGWPESNRHGLLLLGDAAVINKGERIKREGVEVSPTSLVMGSGLYAFDMNNREYWPHPTVMYLPITYDLVTGKILEIQNRDPSEAAKVAADIRKKLPPSLQGRMNSDFAVKSILQMIKISDRIDQEKLGAFLGSSLALINTPRLSQRSLHEPDAKLQKSREKKGKPPLLSWHEITLTVDRGELGHGEPLTETGEKAFHHVRAHLRLKRGKVEIVKPHWRGNPEKGVILHRHVVRRIEDEDGAWKGGPLPFPKIIPELK